MAEFALSPEYGATCFSALLVGLFIDGCIGKVLAGSAVGFSALLVGLFIDGKKAKE